MLMMSFVSIALVTVVWLAAGYSLAFGDDAGGGLIGGLEHAGMADIGPDSVHGTVPTLLFATFQLTFAIITAALISGAVADRRSSRPGWSSCPCGRCSYTFPSRTGCGARTAGSRRARRPGLRGRPRRSRSPPAHPAWPSRLVLGPRIGFKKDAMRPHNLPMVMLGAGLLWFGWFGFNAGSALGANGLAAAAFLNTLVAGCTGLLGWLFVEQQRDGHPTTLGAASGAVAGLVAITPSCGSVSPLGAAGRRPRRRRCLLVRGRLEVPARLRRLARRRRRAPGRRGRSAPC